MVTLILDTDSDGVIDSLDLDADGDGIYDYVEANHGATDSDGDGSIDGPFGTNGVANNVQNTDELQVVNYISQDIDGSEIVNYTPQDTDDDGIHDFQDIDDDNDGILTIDENPDPNENNLPDDAYDSDGDGIPNYLEPNNQIMTEDGIQIFNVMSPNGDGSNDVFVITGLENLENTVSIYNRWGVRIYYTENYGSTNNYFEGFSQGRTTFKDEKQLPDGTYFYIINYKTENGTEKQKVGYLYKQHN